MVVKKCMVHTTIENALDVIYVDFVETVNTVIAVNLVIFAKIVWAVKNVLNV